MNTTTDILTTYDRTGAIGSQPRQVILSDALQAAVAKTPEIRPLIDTLQMMANGLGPLTAAEILFRLFLLIDNPEWTTMLANHHQEAASAATDLQ